MIHLPFISRLSTSLNRLLPTSHKHYVSLVSYQSTVTSFRCWHALILVTCLRLPISGRSAANGKLIQDDVTAAWHYGGWYQWRSQSLKMGGSLSDICDRGAGNAKQTTNLLIFWHNGGSRTPRTPLPTPLVGTSDL
jgi:hypothetical protein